ncbi:MAG: D-2-hydroxyacid dehydrogenase family protein [Vulcanimicrobiaceae bacterium]
MNVAVLDDYQRVARDFADWGSLGSDVKVQFFEDHLEDEDKLVARLAGFEVIAIMRERTPFRRSLIERLPKLKLLVTTGKRNASVDVAACKDRGVTVCGTGISDGSTVELTWALILAVVRGIPREERGMHEGRWQVGLGMEIHGKTLGVVGLGRLGSQVAKIGMAFGMKVIAWSQNLATERANEVGVEKVTKEELFSHADIVTIHYVLSNRSRGLVGAAEFSKMKKTAYLVNTSRGPIVDSAALVDALRSGKIAGAGIDVYDREPLPMDDPLRKAPNAVLLPHVGYVSDGVYRIFYPDTLEDIKAWLSGKPIRVIEP